MPTPPSPQPGAALVAPPAHAHRELVLMCRMLNASINPAHAIAYEEYRQACESALRRTLVAGLRNDGIRAKECFKDLFQSHVLQLVRRTGFLKALLTGAQRLAALADATWIARLEAAVADAIVLPTLVATLPAEELAERATELNERMTRLQQHGAVLLHRFLSAHNFRFERTTDDDELVLGKQLDRLFQDVMSRPDADRRDRLLHLEPGLARRDRAGLADVVLSAGQMMYLLKRCRLPMVGWLLAEARNAATDIMRADLMVDAFDSDFHDEAVLSRHAESSYGTAAVTELLQEIESRLREPARLADVALVEVRQAQAAHPSAAAVKRLAAAVARAERERQRCDFHVRVCLLRLQDCTQDEIADELGVKRDPVRTALDHIENALADLRGAGFAQEVAS